MKKIGFFSILLCFFIASRCFAQLDPKLFPVHPIYAANIEFWKQVFGQYDSQEGIIHDRYDLTRVYTIIKLVDRYKPNAKKTNKSRLKRATDEIKDILRQLANGHSPDSPKVRHIATLFAANAKPKDYLEAMNDIRMQRGIKDRFEAGIVRSGKYMEEIKDIMQSYGVPEALAYLPHVESSFNINAYSKYGAAGMWQFTRGTGKQFMEIDYTLDERRDPILATHAAAKLLKKNYTELNDWPLAITAYNHGLAGMKRAKARHGDYPSVFSLYQSRSFKFASRNFYPEFIAAYEVASKYQQYFGSLELHRPTQFTLFELPGYLPIETLESKLGLTTKEIRRLNPALKKPVLSGQKYIPKGYSLRLPGAIEYQSISQRIALNEFYNRQKPSQYHRVRKGETVSGIAKLHGVKVRDLIVANNLNRKATIYPRQKLRIPGKAGQLAKAPEKLSKKPASANTEAQKPTTGEKLDRKAASSAPVTELAMMAPAQTSKPENQPDNTNAASAALAALEPVLEENPVDLLGHFRVEPIEVNAGRKAGRIRVAYQETIGLYAQWLGVSEATLIQANNLSASSVLLLHQPILIPAENADWHAFAQQRYRFHRTHEEAFFDEYEITRISSYQIKPGDSIWRLSQQVFDVPLWLLSRLNTDVDLSQLQPRQKIQVPLVQTRDTTRKSPIPST